MNVPSLLGRAKSRVENALKSRLGRLDSDSPRQVLVDAMCYGTLGGGKRIRAALVYAAAESAPNKLPASAWDDVACAIEMIHAYSLIHDDLPAMDNDQYRRGQPSCHAKYGEALAILAGDALQAYAFEILSQSESIPAHVRTTVMHTIAKAVGAGGMVGGQVMDILAAERYPVSAQYIRETHRAKTAQLIKASIMSGACEQTDATQVDALEEFSECIGLGFQIKDDLLDAKSAGQKMEPCYPGVVGIDNARRELAQLHRDALLALEPYPQTKSLRVLADYMVERQQ